MNKLIIWILQFNAGREPERLAMKYDNMRKSAFVYLRGTCHLFPGQLPVLKALAKAPAVWSCGDLHLENFGSYKGADELSYFDINDFDESALIPGSLDLVRLLTSIRLACEDLKFKADRVRELIDELLGAYFQELRSGSARSLELNNTMGPVYELLAKSSKAKREKFLDSRTVKKGGKRKLLIDGKKALTASKEQYEQVSEFMKKFSKTQNETEFFEVLDIARRIAGTGSLGLGRYIVLVRGKGNPDDNYLLDLKQAMPSALTGALTLKQPVWASQGERVVTLTRRLHVSPAPIIHAVQMNGTDYMLRDLQPSADKAEFEEKKDGKCSLNNLMRSIGQCTAWSHLRGSGYRGSATTDMLVAFGNDDSWKKVLRKASATTAEAIKAEWKIYSEAYDTKAFKL